MKFLATEFRREGEFSVELEAADWAEAEARCEREGWRLDGELTAVIPASDSFGQAEADALVQAMNEAEGATKQ